MNDAEDFLTELYNSLYKLKPCKRNQILFDLFGWGGQDAFDFIRANRSAVTKNGDGTNA